MQMRKPHPARIPFADAQLSLQKMTLPDVEKRLRTLPSELPFPAD